jgi:glycosyltransferase involved in cell wall biosynthesis
VDDGSTDNTKEIVEDYINRNPLFVIRYLYQENKGTSAARNKGIKYADGEYIAFLDADDIWLPEKLERQIEIMSIFGFIGIVSCNCYIINASGETKGQSIRKKYLAKKDLLRDLLFKNVVSNGSCALVKKECFEKLGMFDENLTGPEDWDMWIRISREYEFRSIDEPLVKIRVRKGSQSYYGDKNLQNELKFLNKIFSEETLKRKWFLKRKAYSYRYFYAAVAYREEGKIEKARKCILRSFFLFPFSFFNKLHLALVLYAIFGVRGFKELKRSICERLRKL